MQGAEAPAAQIGGVQQQQGGRSGTVGFTSQFGAFDPSSVTEPGTAQGAQTAAAAPAPASWSEPATHIAPKTQAPDPNPNPTSGPSGDPAAIVAAIESLAGLHQRGILSDEEFAAKKAELLGRL